MKNNIWNGAPRPRNGTKALRAMETTAARHKGPWPGAYLPVRITHGIDITETAGIHPIAARNQRLFSRFSGTENLLHYQGVNFTGFRTPNWYEVGRNLPVRWVDPAQRVTSTATKNLAPAVSEQVNKYLTQRVGKWMGGGLMVGGAMSTYSNARDGRYGRAAIGAGMTVAGYQLYHNPQMAAGLANSLLERAPGIGTKITGMANSLMRALGANA